MRVVQRFGWAHSFLLEAQPVGARGEPGGASRARCRATPADAPFIVHVAEGVDEEARGELPRLEALGCLKPNTVIVHGVAMTRTAGGVLRARAAAWSGVRRRTRSSSAGRRWSARSSTAARRTRGASRSAPTRASPARAICSTSCARPMGPRLVTADELLRDGHDQRPRDVLQLPEAGRIGVGQPADLLVVPGSHTSAADALANIRRADVQLVTIGGRAMVADRPFRELFRARHAEGRPIVIDGTEHLADAEVARHIARCPIQEPGVASVE